MRYLRRYHWKHKHGQSQETGKLSDLPASDQLPPQAQEMPQINSGDECDKHSETDRLLNSAAEEKN